MKVNNIAPREHELKDMLKRMRIKATFAYFSYTDQLKLDKCLGWETRITPGEFGEDELKAHCAAAEQLGRNKALDEALRSKGSEEAYYIALLKIAAQHLVLEKIN